jgi:hypothetical protein
MNRNEIGVEGAKVLGKELKELIYLNEINLYYENNKETKLIIRDYRTKLKYLKSIF